MTLNLIFVTAVIIAFIAIIFLFWYGERNRSDLNSKMSELSATTERLVQELVQHSISSQAELKGRMEQGQTSVNERFEALNRRLGDSLNQQTEKTGVTLKQLNERLAIIDTAQKNITGLSEQMVDLQTILSNKQARGAFGEIQLNDLVRSILPPSVYSFQTTLTNGKRADCVLDLPNPPGPIVIDSKFPLEAYYLLQNAEDEISQRTALRSLGAAIIKHVNDIKEKYIIIGETAESALMFLPSEAIYAELHANLPEVVEKSYHSKVWIVSPTTLMATLNTVRAVLKDVNMREQASVIQSEVQIMLEDVKRLNDRIHKLQSHMRQTDDDLNQINTSTGKITKRSERIIEIELGENLSSDDLNPVKKNKKLSAD